MLARDTRRRDFKGRPLPRSRSKRRPLCASFATSVRVKCIVRIAACISARQTGVSRVSIKMPLGTKSLRCWWKMGNMIMLTRSRRGPATCRASPGALTSPRKKVELLTLSRSCPSCRSTVAALRRTKQRNPRRRPRRRLRRHPRNFLRRQSRKCPDGPLSRSSRPSRLRQNPPPPLICHDH